MLKRILQTPQTPFWLISFSAMIALTLPVLIQDGMFMDGMLYTCVSHNLANDFGTFWFPQFSLHNVAGLPSFHEQPPLVFGIQAVFFKLLGNSMYVERFYTFLTLCITAFLVTRLWKKIYEKGQALEGAGWLPVLLWITIPVCFWSFSNNMHENTMGIFTLAAVFFGYKASSGERSGLIPSLLAGFFIFLATLSKGIPGFFPLSVPALYWLIMKRETFSRAMIHTAVIAVVPAILYTALFMIPESKESLSVYLFERAFNRISDVPTVDNRYYILYRLFMEMLPQILFVGIILFIGKLKQFPALSSAHIRTSVFFFGIGAAASFPLMLTLVQKGFYFVPALPFFAIGLAILIAPPISDLIARLNVYGRGFRVLLLFSASLLTGAIIFSFLQRGKISRNHEMLHDVYAIGKQIPGETVVSVPPETWNEWDLQCYMMRYNNMSLTAGNEAKYYLAGKSSPPDSLQYFEKVDIHTLRYDLYRKK